MGDSNQFSEIRLEQCISSPIVISSKLKHRCLCVVQGSCRLPRKTRNSNDRSCVK